MKTRAILDQEEREYGRGEIVVSSCEASAPLGEPTYTEEDLKAEIRKEEMELRTWARECDREEEKVEEKFCAPKSELRADGMIVWMECNHPGVIYISSPDHKDWSDFNGYAPCEVKWAWALACLAGGDRLQVISGPLSEWAVKEMAR